MLNHFFILTLTMTTSVSSISALSNCITICSTSHLISHLPQSTTCYGGACLQLEKNYNRFSIADSGTDTPHQVKLAITIFSISNIEIDEGSFEVEMWLQLTWQDDRLRVCQCRERGNRKFIKLSGELEDVIWMPDLEVMNLLDVEKEVGLSKHGGVRLVNHENTTGVLYDMKIQAVINCHFIASWFPFDSNLCVVRIGSDLHPASQMVISMDKLPDLKMKSSIGFDFTLEKLDDEQSSYFPLSRYSGGEFQCVGFKIGFRRIPVSIMYQYTAMIGIMVIMTTLTVILPSTTVDRLGPIGVILIGALTVYYTVSLNFPRPATGLSPLVIYVLTGLGICYFSLIELCLVLKVRRQDNHAWVERVDKTFLGLGLITWVISTLVLWLGGQFLADKCANGFKGESGACYHNVDF